MKKLSLLSLVSILLFSSIISNSQYSINIYYDLDDMNDEYDEYYNYKYNSDYNKYYSNPYYNSYYSSYSKEQDLYEKEKKAEQAYLDARIAKLKARLARLRHQNAPRHQIMKVERELKDAIYDRYPTFNDNPVSAKEVLIAAGIVFILAGLLE